jgi:N,N'-diacetylchitobiose transport system permease protein
VKKSSWLSNIFGLSAILLFGFPVYWMVNTSFKSAPEILTVKPQFIPLHPTLSNYTQAFHTDFFFSAVRNSLIVVTSTVLISLAIALLASIAVARTEFKGKSAYIVMILIVQMFPLIALLIPLFVLLSKAGLADTLPGVIVAYIAFVLPFVIWTLRGFLMSIPVEIEEAALIDGCSRPQAYRRVLFPLMAPGLVATGTFAFIQAWNEFLLAYIITSSQEKATLPVWLAGFTTRTGTNWGPLMAASCLASIPVVAAFLALQSKIATGITAGAIKG